MKVIGNLVIVVLLFFCISSVVGHFYGYTITFPQFSITKGYDIPEHRLHAIRLSLMCTFVFFGFRYLFFGSEKLYPICFSKSSSVFLDFIMLIQKGQKQRSVNESADFA